MSYASQFGFAGLPVRLSAGFYQLTLAIPASSGNNVIAVMTPFGSNARWNIQVVSASVIEVFIFSSATSLGIDMNFYIHVDIIP